MLADKGPNLVAIFDGNVDELQAATAQATLQAYVMGNLLDTGQSPGGREICHQHFALLGPATCPADQAK